MRTIFLFNATGMQGQSILYKLSAAGHHIIAPVRSPEQANQLQARGFDAFVTDFSTKSLASKMQRAERIILQIPAQIAPTSMILMTKASIDAIKEVGSPKTIFVISSTVPDEKVGIETIDARVEMKDYALKHLPNVIVFSVTEYFDNFSNAYRESIEQHGIIPQTIPPSYAVNYLSWNDLAKYVVAALDMQNLEGKLHRIGGKEGIKGHQLAQRLGNVLGKELQYLQISHKDLASILTPILGEALASDYAEFYEYQDTKGQHLLNPDTSDIRTILGIQVSGLEDWAREAYSK